ncbi:glycine betaine ABC transporter substrate-binding protein [Rhizobium sp. Root482]|uniref:glycine betaine ABC transporter substrate-binding protein n=1 Tax=Rhizobium sp. Root482 TaxID=1736543 RepID=UPI0006F66420|nr:glycine betaine ABC transporter substrate-binding protein [Rhizobium sp. Root482]KQY26948.1 glycine/betaine ABC transporter substrate-binding protein [Rhizobium sp. Root482]
MSIIDILRNAVQAAVVAGLAMTGTSAAAQDIKVGGKDFTEQFLLAEMTTQLLQKNGFTVSKRDGMGTNIVRAALENGEVDVYWEYTGTALVNFNKITDRLTPEETYKIVKEKDAERGITWLAPSRANNTYALAIRKDNPTTDGMVSLSDLAAAYSAGKSPLMATTAEFPKRQDGLLGLQETYGFEAKRRNIRPMDIGLVFPALQNGDVDLAVVAATDGRIAAMDLVLLKDDKHFFPDYALVPTIRTETLDANPRLGELLDQLSAKLDDATMQRLNGEIDVERKSVEEVATAFLTSSGLL